MNRLHVATHSAELTLLISRKVVVRGRLSQSLPVLGSSGVGRWGCQEDKFLEQIQGVRSGLGREHKA